MGILHGEHKLLGTGYKISQDVLYGVCTQYPILLWVSNILGNILGCLHGVIGSRSHCDRNETLKGFPCQKKLVIIICFVKGPVDEELEVLNFLTTYSRHSQCRICKLACAHNPITPFSLY